MALDSFKRYSLFPIKYPSLYKFYETQRDAFWFPAEVELTEDVQDWNNKLKDADRHFLTYTLAFFAQADALILENLDVNFSMDINIPEASIFYGLQSGIESIHWEMYSLLIETLVQDPKQKEKALSAIEHYPSIAKKALWVKKWFDRNISYPARLIAFACVEGIFFSSAFASIFYFKKRGLMPGLSVSNKFIARDEGIHRDFAIELFQVLRKQNITITDTIIYDIVKEAVDIENNFVKESLDVELIGINSNNMSQYVKYVADHLLSSLGLTKLYNVENPFEWMAMISLNTKQNFFEGRVSEYKKKSTNQAIEFNAEF
jgi:ribonucleotide reductase beta subunit family protein with ferritin-like domain